MLCFMGIPPMKRCHSRRGAQTDGYAYGRSLLDTHRPSLVVEGHLFPDDQT
jgi:hypothetical protein